MSVPTWSQTTPWDTSPQMESTARLDRRSALSLDARVMLQPTHAFRLVASINHADGLWVAARRPLFLTAVLASVVSILTSSAVTLRIVGPAALYWTFVPLAELVGLFVVAGRRCSRVSASVAIDAFFAGHGPWTLNVIALAVTVSAVRPDEAWHLLTMVCLPITALVIAWSAYIDFRFFREFLSASRVRALVDVTLVRLVTWPLVFGIFAVPGMGASALARELMAIVQELLK
jgi:hypothetical protein